MNASAYVSLKLVDERYRMQATFSSPAAGSIVLLLNCIVLNGPVWFRHVGTGHGKEFQLLPSLLRRSDLLW